jgi:predicted dehydrogenase
VLTEVCASFRRVSHATAAAPDHRPAPPRAGLRVGIVGAGFMARVHARAARVAGAAVVGVVASAPERAGAVAAEFRAERPVPDVAALLDASPDVVHVCTPNHLHARGTLDALAAGAHVICEKPLAVSAAEADGMLEAARGRVAAVPFVYRFHPMVREARATVRAGGIGRINLVHGSYLQDWLLRPEDDNWRVDPALGGASRAFGDIGSHWCDLAEFVTGDRITRVHAASAAVHSERGDRPVRTEDVVTLQFATASGALGSAVISQVSAGRKNRLFLEISGDDGSIAFDQEQPELLWQGRRDGNRVLMRDPETLSPAAARYARVPAGHAQGYQDCFDAFVADAYAAIDGPAPDGLPVFADGARAVRICEAVLASAASGTWQPVRA